MLSYVLRRHLPYCTDYCNNSRNYIWPPRVSKTVIFFGTLHNFLIGLTKYKIAHDLQRKEGINSINLKASIETI